MTPRRFRNLFAVLANLDLHELEEAGVIHPGAVGGTSWDRWNRDPVMFVLKLNDDRLAKLVALIEAREPAWLMEA